MKKHALIILTVLLAFSCSPEDETIQEKDTNQSINFQSNLISINNLYGAGEEGIDQQNLIITDRNTWQNLMDQMNSVNNTTVNFSETEVDFSEYQIIAVFDTVRGYLGYSLELGVVTMPDGISITVTTIVPEGDATYTITQPYHIIKIPVTTLPIVFE